MKKSLVVIMCSIVCMSIFVGCASETVPAVPTPIMSESLEEATQLASNFNAVYPKEIVDLAGRKVTLKAAPKRIVSTVYQATSTLLALGVRNIVGVEYGAQVREIYKLSAAEFIKASQVGSSRQLDLGRIQELSPDLLIVTRETLDQVPTQHLLDYPVIVVDASSEETYLESVKLLGEVTNSKRLADELIAFHVQTAAYTKSLTQALQHKPSVYIAGPNGTVKNTAFQQEAVTNAGGILMAEPTANMWNPDFIFVVSYAGFGEDAIKNDPLLQSVTAVLKGQVAIYPSALEPWDLPTASAPLGQLWLLNQLHPEVMPDGVYLKAVDDFYAHFYGFGVTGY